jgi:hypothetical protein
MTLIPELERDLVAAAGRTRSPRRRMRQAGALGAAVAAATAVAVVTLWPSDEGPGPSRAAGDRRPAPPAPPSDYPPVHGTLVRLSSFEFDGVRYRLSGYRGRGGVVCVRIAQSPPEPGASDGRPSVACAGGPYLRRSLRRERVLNVGTGGGAHLVVAGFTVPEVSKIGVVGTDWPAHAELTRPFRPWNGARIRAFTIVVAPPSGVKVPRAAYLRIRAKATELRIPADR